MSDKRAAILEATLRLISKHGFHGTAMSKVSKEACVSVGTIYHYFDSKDDLIDELYKAIKHRFAEAILKDFDQNQPLRTQIRQIKDFPDAVILSLTIDVATSLAQKHAAGFINLTDELIERIIDASWEAIRQ